MTRLWQSRVEFVAGQASYAAFASHAAADGGVPFWGDESGASSNEPLWDFQNVDGTPGALAAFLHAYALTADRAYLRRAERIGDTLLWIQEQLGGGWFQDGAVVNGQYRNVGVWGSWSDRRHEPTNLQGFFTLDDVTSQSCAHGLLRLYQAGGEPRFRDGAMRFGDLLSELPGVEYNGMHPYANGGIPQVLPLARALSIDLNQNLDARNPDGPYMPHKTLNDNCMSTAIVFLMELFAETGETRYHDAVVRNIDWLLDRQAAYGHRGWAQQYHFLTDRIAWARNGEPPAMVTCETNVVEMLLLWRQRETDPVRRARIDFSLSRYLQWLSQEVHRPAEQLNRVWRYYNFAGSGGPADEAVFASSYERWVGPEYESRAAPGQPYRGEWDLLWATRLTDGHGAFDLSRAGPYLQRSADLPFQIIPVRWTPTAAAPDAVWTSTVEFAGQQRLALLVRGTVQRVEGLVISLLTLPGNVVDSDADFVADADERAQGANPHDSDNLPLDPNLGDMNCDGQVSVTDVGGFVLAVANAPAYADQYPDCNRMRADVDADGAVGLADIGAFVELLTQP